ncbi:MAG: hypothetical protein A2W26_08970 [Acidobacteria bacterium RBG_16_64_8]|nr:MAG: hypothetical protein A2W26_08970 [Acidobacteria bacterium RBG_16_64_8]
MNLSFGAEIHELRKNKALTLRELAKRVGVSPSYLSKIENERGDYRPREDTIRSLADALGSDPEQLILLADKIPGDTRTAIAGNPAAQAFLRNAAGFTDKDWRNALRVIPARGGRTRAITLVDATHLKAWADRLDSRAELPRLIRDLVNATAKPPISISFRASEGTDLSGWDGRVTVDKGNALIPDGASGWELSTRKDIEKKANQDYEQRTQHPEDLEPASATYVSVTLRRWPGKRAWAKIRREERVWRDVRSYDADDLEAWLDIAPAVHDRLSRYLGVSPEGSVGLETFWRNWTESTDPPLNAKIVTAGRSQTIQQIHERFQAWAQRKMQTIEIRAGSREEALAVFAASVFLLPDDARETIRSRCLVVETLAAWRDLVGSKEPLILVPRFNPKEEIAAALRNQHLVVLLLDPADGDAPSAIQVGRLSREEVSQELISGGIPEQRAKELGVVARRGLPHLVRELAVHPVERPRWASSTVGQKIAPLLLAGAWSDSMEADQRIIERLTHSPYREVCRELTLWANEPDPPLKRVKDRWSFVSHQEAWKVLAPLLTTQDLELLIEISTEVLSVPDPAFDLPDANRWIARAIGAAPRHSEYLREGLCEALALAGAFSEEIRTNSISPSAEYAQRAVRKLLECANNEWKVWASLSGELTLIAEAAPDEFLEAALTGVEGSAPVLRNLFHDKDASFFSSSPHTGLLWALETLAWDPDYLGQATQALAGLAKIDPGGKLSNRPQRSLRGIFLPWHPQTLATLEQRFDAIDSVLRDYPEPGWRLLCDTLPEAHAVGMNAPHARFRHWGKEEPSKLTRVEYARAIQCSVERVLHHVGASGARWADLIEALPYLSDDQHKLVVAQLENLNVGRLEKRDRARMWHSLRKLLAVHRSFSDADWALPSDRIDALASILSRLTPPDLTARYAWLFSYNPDLPEGRDRDWEARDREAETQRHKALEEIFQKSGLKGILQLLAEVNEPGVLGLTLGRMPLLGDAVESFLQENLSHEDPRRATMARGVCVGAVEKQGREWLEKLTAVRADSWAASKRAQLLLCLPADTRSWDLVAQSGASVEQAYWEGVVTFLIPPASALPAIQKLLGVQRPSAAAVVAYRANHGGMPVLGQVIASILESLPKESDLTNMDAYIIDELLATLEPTDEVPEDRIAGIEWILLPLLEHGRHRPRFLFARLARDPQFYIDVLRLVYRAEDEEKKVVSKQEQLRAQLGHQLLDGWRSSPGSHAGGGLDREALSDWVRAARKLAEEYKRGTIADQMIGQMLSGCPAGTDGIWPHEAIRDLFQEVRSVELERGFQIGRFNSRGVVSKAMFEGGVKERSLAEEYRRSAKKITNRWPRAAAVLRRMADSYESDARREDAEAELREDDLTT